MGGKVKKEKVAFKDRKLVVWAKEHAPDLVGGILETTGTLLQINVLKDLGEKISAKNDLTPEQKAEAMELYKIDLAFYEAENADRSDARKREIEIAKTGKSDWMMRVVGLIVMAAFVFIIVNVVYYPGLKDNPLATHLLGIVEVAAIGIINYYYGSSKGSKDKTQMMNSKN